MDGVDAAYIETDGARHLVVGGDGALPFADGFRSRLRAFVASAPARGATPLEAELTDLHAEAVARLLAKLRLRSDQIDLLGFHGQTIWHRPRVRETWQMGDAQRLADATGIAVVSDFRTADVKAGGQGAPLVPIYHAALAREMEKPVAILNIGGVGNVTWIGGEDDLIAFDTGPGNALIDDWVNLRAGRSMDDGGRIAAAGAIEKDVLARMMDHPYFDKPPPKSLDRHDFSAAPVSHLSLEDGAATLTAFTATAIARGLAHCPRPPKRLLVTGGGRHNAALMGLISAHAGIAAESVDGQGWMGDALEAQAFAYLAARAVRGLPISFPGTTGAPAPMTGGVVTAPARKSAASA